MYFERKVYKGKHCLHAVVIFHTLPLVHALIIEPTFPSPLGSRVAHYHGQLVPETAVLGGQQSTAAWQLWPGPPFTVLVLHPEGISGSSITLYYVCHLSNNGEK